MCTSVTREVVLIIPMYPNMELAAAQTASVLAETGDFDENQIDEIKLAIIETCINAFEHSNSQDQRVFATFILKEDQLQMTIRDGGAGFATDAVRLPDASETDSDCLRKRGWRLAIIREMMDCVEVESDANGTTITLVKYMTKPIAPARWGVQVG